MSFNCEIRRQESQPTLSIKAKAAVKDFPIVLGKGFGDIMRYMSEINESPAGAPFVAYTNRDFASMDIEIGFPMSRRLPGKGDIKAGELPEGMYATCMYKGPYSECGPAYEALMQYVQERGHETIGVAYEFYLNDPGKTPPSELITLIVFPLKNS